MATKTFKVSLSLDNPRIVQSGIDVRSFDKQSIKIAIELTKNSQTYQIPTGTQIKISLLKLARQEQKIILDVPFTSAEAIEWLVPDYLDGYQGEVRVGVYLIAGTENIDVGYFNIASKVSDIDKAAEEFTDNVMQGWDKIEADLAEIRDMSTQFEALASDVTSKYNAFDSSVTQANQTIDDILALQPQFQSVLDETTGKDVISAPEIILARDGASTLGERLDSDKAEVGAQLAHIASLIGAKGDGSGSIEIVQSDINTITSKHKKVLFPYKGLFYFSSDLYIPADTEIDFNNSIIYTDKSIVLQGENIKIHNLTVVDTHPESGDESGISTGSNKCDNLLLSNVKTEGFYRGIQIGNVNVETINVVVEYCESNNSRSFGLSVVSCKDVFILNHSAQNNRRDGFKTIGNCNNTTIIGGVFSSNGDEIEYADGIDLYDGGYGVKIIGATIENNSGAGIHVANGDNTNPDLYPNIPTVNKITISSCHLKNNNFGVDVVIISNTNSVYPSNVNINNCIFEENRHGIYLKARNVVIGGCIFENNTTTGVHMEDSKNINLHDNIIYNTGEYGYRINSSRDIKISGGMIDGYSPYYEKIGDVITPDPTMINGLRIDLSASTRDIEISGITIMNYTGNTPIQTNFTSSNLDATVIIRDIEVPSGVLLSNIRCSQSSILRRNKRVYKKNDNINGVDWGVERISKSGTITFSGDGSNTAFTIGHGLPDKPITINLSPRTTSDLDYPFALQSDSDVINVNFKVAPSTGNHTFNWHAEC